MMPDNIPTKSLAPLFTMVTELIPQFGIGNEGNHPLKKTLFIVIGYKIATFIAQYLGYATHIKSNNRKGGGHCLY